MFYLVFIICGFGGNGCGPVMLPQTFATYDDCRHAGGGAVETRQTETNPVGGGSIESWICIKGK